MKLSRIIYGILVGVSVLAYFQPWAIMGGQLMIGFATILPFSFFYFIGLILGIVIFFTGYRATGLSIFAGILMFLGTLITGVVLGFTTLSGQVTLEPWFAYAFALSFVFPILAPILGHQFDKTSHHRVSSEGLGSKIFWCVIVAIIVGVFVNWIS